MIENLKAQLDKFGYKHYYQKGSLVVKTAPGQIVFISESDDGKYLIDDRLKNYNPLTGVMEMSLYRATMLNSVVILFMFAFVGFMSIADQEIPNFFIIILASGIGFWIVIWTCFYLIKLEIFKMQVRLWG